MFEQAVRVVPDDSTLVGNLADAYRASGDSAKAMATYDKAISLALKELQLNPRKAGSYGNLGLYYAKKGDGARAVEAIHKARTIDPNDVQLVYGEAEIQALAGHHTESIDALREALKKNYPAAEAENDPELDSVRGLPEFKKLMAEYSKKSK
jgi:tetratricopeptide (TPR) repeat protein